MTNTTTIYNGDMAGTLSMAQPIYMGSGVTFNVTTPNITSGTLTFKHTQKQQISAKLYLKFVKSKLTKVQIEKVNRRLAKLQKLVIYSSEMGQQALYEELTKEVAILIREAEMVSLGINSWVSKEHIDKFKNDVKEKVIKFDTLENFPRVIPANVQRKLKGLKKAGVFDQFHILFIDYTDEKLKTNKEKIREKDPILFGQLKYQPNRFYYIADWVDEYCDLTLDKMVDKIRLDDPEFELGKIDDISQERWDGIVNEVKERIDRLSNTKPSNYRDLMSVEDEARRQREAAVAQTKEATVELNELPEIPASQKKWWKFW